MDMRIPRLKIKIKFESNPPKSRILVRRLAVHVLPARGRDVFAQYQHSADPCCLTFTDANAVLIVMGTHTVAKS